MRGENGDFGARPSGGRVAIANAECKIHQAKRSYLVELSKLCSSISMKVGSFQNAIPSDTDIYREMEALITGTNTRVM